MSGPYESIGDGGAGPASAAKEAAAGAKEAVLGAVTSVPEIKIYLEPIDPASNLPMKDRADLVLQSKRPWSDFADVSKFNIPPLAQWKERLVTNFETFFYNYFLLALAFLVVFAFGHFWSVLALVADLAIAFFLYVLHPEPVTVGSFEIGSNGKHAIVIVATILALFVAHVLKLLFSLLIFLVILVGVHGSIREHTE